MENTSKLEIAIIGKGKLIRTKLINIEEIAANINKPTLELLYDMRKSMGCQVIHNEDGYFIVGEHSDVEISDILKGITNAHS